MNFLTYSLIFSLLTTLGTNTETSDFHKYYFSKMTMERNIENNSLEVEFRFFSDDLEKALGESEDFHLRLGDSREIENADILIYNYLRNHVSISGSGWNGVKPEYIGKEIKNDISYVYVEYPGVTEWSEITIKNTMMLEIFEGQLNEISLIVGKELITKETRSGKTSCQFNLAND